MSDKYRDAVKLQTPEGLFLVEMEEVSRKRITTKDDLIKEIIIYIRQTQEEERAGFGRVSISPVTSLAHLIANFLEDKGWFVPKPL